MPGWADRMVTERRGRTVPGWDLGGSLDRSWKIRLLNHSRAAAEGTVADCRTRHRIAAGFGMAAADVAAGSFLRGDRADCHRMAGTGDHGDTAGTAGRWIRDTTGLGPCAHCRMMAGEAVGSLAVASGHIPVNLEFRGFRTAEAARRTRTVAVVVAVGSNPGSSHSCRPRQRGLVVGIGSWFRRVDLNVLLLDLTDWECKRVGDGVRRR
jgi:hypothetical protein